MHTKKKPQNSPRVCIFCGGTPISSEHLFSKWISGVVPKTSERHTQFITKLSGIKLKLGEPAAKRREGDISSKRLKVVCLKCNNQWMSAIDDQAKAPLSRMILGESCIISTADQKIISEWIALKVIVGEYDDPSTAAIPKAQAHQFYSTREKPTNWQAWVGHYVGSEWSQGTRFTHIGGNIGHSLEQGGYNITTPLFSIQTTTLVIGKLLIHAYSTNAPRMTYGFTGELGRKLTLLPSDNTDALIWSPPEGLGDLEAGLIAYSLTKGTQRAAP